MSFPQVRTSVQEFPSTLIKLMGIEIPTGMPSPNAELLEKFNPTAIVIIIIDNFGLFEAVVYKPEAMIKNLEALALIETADPYAIPLMKSLLRPTAGFHLMQLSCRLQVLELLISPQLVSGSDRSRK